MDSDVVAKVYVIGKAKRWQVLVVCAFPEANNQSQQVSQKLNQRSGEGGFSSME
jgi:hypothetical protein